MTNPIIDEAIKRFEDKYKDHEFDNRTVGQIWLYPDFKKFLSSELQTAIIQTRESMVERIKSCRSYTFQPVGGLSNIEYISKDDVISTLLPTSKEI